MVNAQDVQPQVYTPAPVGVNLLTLGYAFSTGAVLFDKTIPIENANADIHSISAAYSRSIGLFGLAGRADIAVPFVVGSWEGEVERTEQNTSRTGFADPTLRFALFIAGAPALTQEEFAGFKPKTILGFTLRLRMPLGQYDANRLVNLGTNRWTISPQLGISHLAGRIGLEAYAGVWFFTDNDEFLGTQTQSQDPLYTIQVHASYRFRSRLWIAASSRQSLGGAVSVDGGDKLEAETNNRVGLTLALPLGTRNALKLVATTGLKATVGNDYSTFAVVWQTML
ncbi:MAG: hypothetical protein AMS21_08710 [Gemmatimonas sp. SG8_38_2]|nr:MAG: hypothetical protein AMS21_08710 [Gemmatimonas sp. SG8_38_2]